MTPMGCGVSRHQMPQFRFRQPFRKPSPDHTGRRIAGPALPGTGLSLSGNDQNRTKPPRPGSVQKMAQRCACRLLCHPVKVNPRVNLDAAPPQAALGRAVSGRRLGFGRPRLGGRFPVRLAGPGDCRPGRFGHPFGFKVFTRRMERRHGFYHLPPDLAFVRFQTAPAHTGWSNCSATACGRSTIHSACARVDPARRSAVSPQP